MTAADPAADAHPRSRAQCLGLGLRTVQRHMSYLMEVLGVRGRFAAARAGWLDAGAAHGRYPADRDDRMR